MPQTKRWLTVFGGQCPIDKADIVVDAWRTGNEGRFVNDSLGAHQTQPNCELEWTWCDALKQPILFIVALREIRRGEELLADYGETMCWGCARALCSRLTLSETGGNRPIATCLRAHSHVHST